ncbi:MAG: galactose mutarotase [Oscillospiraceae bacterium]|nr:galactose mutarotase [Oscillospiraceae bacterium]
MSVSVRSFGLTRRGEAVKAYTIQNAVGASVTLLDYGATVQSLCIPDKDDVLTDVVLGYDTVAAYEEHDAYLGATIGRVGNRIGGARFSLNGKEYALADNAAGNCLHGGLRGFDKHVWQAEIADERSVRFSRLSPDGEENFPGNLEVSVTFILTDDCALVITYDAVSDADTLVNLTNHSYFDLSGCGKAMDQTLFINAVSFLELGAGTLPTGRQLSVGGTPFDFRTPKRVGRDIAADDKQLRAGGGYDHNFCLSGPYAAMLESRITGIRMEVFTDLPGVQLYTANFLGNQAGKGGRQMHDRDAVCLETQLYPNAMNCWGFPSPVLRKGQHMNTTTTYQFSLFM